MTVYPTLPFGHTTFCDDIRHEIGGKLSLLGIYHSSLVVKELPVKLPKFCFYITYNEETNSSGHRQIKILYEMDQDDGTSIEKTLMEAEYEVPEEAISAKTEEFSMRTNRMELVAAPFTLEHTGKLRVRSYQDGKEIALGAILIELEDSAENNIG